MHPTNPKPSPCRRCGTPVFSEIYTGDPIELEAHPTQTLYRWHRCPETPRRPVADVEQGPKPRHGHRGSWQYVGPLS